MLRRLQDRLLLSYFLVIATILLAISLLLPIIINQFRSRLAVGQLQLIGRVAELEAGRLLRSGADMLAVQRTMGLIAESQGVRLLLVNPETQRIVYDSQPNSGWVGQDLSQMGQLTRLSARSQADGLPSGRFRTTDGALWDIHTQPLNPAGARSLLLITGRPADGALLAITGNLLTPLVLTGLLALIPAGLLAYFIARSVSRPLQQMATAAEAIADGHLDQQLSPEGPDEVRRLAEAFNYMSQQVAAGQQVQREFLSNVSHELKTPLTSIQGYSQALLDGVAEEPAARTHAAQIIHDEAGRMARLVQELLDLARLESGRLKLNLEPVDLGDLLTDVQRNLLVQAQQRRVQLTLEKQPVPPLVGDRDRLVQVFTNLVDNGLAYTPAGGRVHIGLRLHSPSAVEVTVQDTGPGIPPEERSRIFERFYQAEKARARSLSRSGYGLGLSITRELVEAHHGRIEVRSEVGRGTLFLVRLPLTQDPAGSTAVRRH